MLIAEQFLLLCLDEQRGHRSISSEKLDPALGAAVLVELALSERIGVTGKEASRHQRGRVTITSTKPTDDPVLDQAMA
ncbi:MAG TPA: GPP34 family phosphoprotein, partial [Propionibacteriaceae bacterium]